MEYPDRASNPTNSSHKVGEAIRASRRSRGAFRVRLQHRWPLVPRNELDLAELRGLETAGGAEAFAERSELEWRNRLHDVELADEHLHDPDRTLQRRRGPVGLILRQQVPGVLQLMQHALEPQFVDLVNDDEQRLVVGAGKRLLQRQEFSDLQTGLVVLEARIRGHRRPATFANPGMSDGSRQWANRRRRP
ncbi:MAG: hypothetical protein OXH52_07160 [Gammaproteobacteria bacterium]|nr:hypothetical protein [Gammaproteobacteria bacterium]